LTDSSLVTLSCLSSQNVVQWTSIYIIIGRFVWIQVFHLWSPLLMTSQHMSSVHTWQVLRHTRVILTLGGKKKTTLGIAPHVHTSEKAYLASTVCHGQHDVFVSNGSCIRLGNMMENTRAVSDATRASSFLLSSVFPSLFTTTKRDQFRDESFKIS